MKRILLIALCLLFLIGCVSSPKTPEASPTPVLTQTPPPVTKPLPHFEPPFPFTEENYPRVDGSTATIPLIEAVESVLLQKPRSEIQVSISKTSAAYVALANNEADVLLVYDGGDETRLEVSAEELFETVPIGKDALVFVVSKDNPIDSLSTEQVRKIFSGEYTNWSELGGSDSPIKAYQRGIGSGSQALMDKLVMDGTPMADPAKVLVIGDMGGLIDAVADYSGGPTGIGYNVFFYVTEMKKNDQIKILSIDGIAPNYDTIQSGDYPFVSEFYSVIRKSEPDDSPARALHEWMLTGEAQNLMASENYVALHANPGAQTPHADGSFSMYPEGEAPVYFQGTNPLALEASNRYGQLYFYLGSVHHEDFSSPRFYGLCTENGEIVTEPVYTVATLLTDSQGNKAYLCYRSDLELESETVVDEDWTYERIINPAILFATDGSWILELDGIRFFYGFAGAGDVIMNADILAAKLEGKWGAVNMKGEVVIPFEKDYSEGIYLYSHNDMHYSYLGVTGDRFMQGNYNSNSDNTFSLYDGELHMIADDLYGMPVPMSGEFIITTEWDSNNGCTIYTYTIDGYPIAKLEPDEVEYYGASPLGDYVHVRAEKSSYICDRELNIIYEFAHNYNEQYGYYESVMSSTNVIHKSDEKTNLHRTYLPDGTRLVTWYDPDMYDQYYEFGY